MRALESSFVKGWSALTLEVLTSMTGDNSAPSTTLCLNHQEGRSIEGGDTDLFGPAKPNLKARSAYSSLRKNISKKKQNF